MEGGEIAFPVEEITIASNLKDMFRSLVTIGCDVYESGGRQVGSVLLDRMKVAGS